MLPFLTQFYEYYYLYWSRNELVQDNSYMITGEVKSNPAHFGREDGYILDRLFNPRAHFAHRRANVNFQMFQKIQAKITIHWTGDIEFLLLNVL